MVLWPQVDTAFVTPSLAGGAISLTAYIIMLLLFIGEFRCRPRKLPQSSLQFERKLSVTRYPCTPNTV